MVEEAPPPDALATEAQAEVWFYHLMTGETDRALAKLLEKTLERDWRALVLSPVEGRLEALDGFLWSFEDASFLPHGRAGGSQDGDQPILLASDGAVLDNRDVAFLLDLAPLPRLEALKRVIMLFRNDQPDEVAEARSRWKSLKAQGVAISYWQQDETGRFQKKA